MPGPSISPGDESLSDVLAHGLCPELSLVSPELAPSQRGGGKQKLGLLNFTEESVRTNIPSQRDKTIGSQATGAWRMEMASRLILIQRSKYMEFGSKETKTTKCRGQHLTFKVHSKTIRVQIQDREDPKIRFKMTHSNVP